LIFKYFIREKAASDMIVFPKMTRVHHTSSLIAGYSTTNIHTCIIYSK